jgi:cysteine dioxygenase
MSIEERIRFDNTIRGTDADAVNQLFGRLDLDKKEWTKYAMFDPSKNYTRNLIATDDETFTLLLLCWNAGKESPIHDHVSECVCVCVCV